MAAWVQGFLKTEEVKTILSDILGMGGEAGEVSGMSSRFLLFMI